MSVKQLVILIALVLAMIGIVVIIAIWIGRQLYGKDDNVTGEDSADNSIKKQKT